MSKIKKLLIVIFITLCIFQMIVLATAIDMGNAATDRSDSLIGNRTIIDRNNPANASGTITTIEIWANTEMSGAEVAIFTQGDANVFTTRDFETVNNGNGAGVVLAGSKQTFTVDLDVVTGDFLGMFYATGRMEHDGGTADGRWWYVGDAIPADDTTFTAQADITFSLHGTGATVEAGTSIMFTFSDF